MTNKKIHPRAEFVSKFIRSSFSTLLVLRCPVRPVRTPSMAGFLTSSKRCRGPGIEIWLPAGVSEEGDNAAIDLQVSVPPQPGQKYRGRQKCRPLQWPSNWTFPQFDHGWPLAMPNFHFCNEFAPTGERMEPRS
jgi:hypothetical protein